MQVAISYAYEKYGVQWNQLMAGATLATAVPIILILPFQRYYIGKHLGHRGVFPKFKPAS